MPVDIARLTALSLGFDPDEPFPSLPVEEYADILALQGGSCPICGVVPDAEQLARFRQDWLPNRTLRALLCTPCFRGMAFFEGNADRLRAAIKYLDREPVFVPTVKLADGSDG